MKKYWSVYKEGSTGGGPKKLVFSDRNEAEAYATRCAAKNPGLRFIIMEAVATVLIPEQPKSIIEPID